MEYLVYKYDDGYCMPVHTIHNNHDVIPATREGSLKRLRFVDLYHAFHGGVASKRSDHLTPYKRRGGV